MMNEQGPTCTCRLISLDYMEDSSSSLDSTGMAPLEDWTCVPVRGERSALISLDAIAPLASAKEGDILEYPCDWLAHHPTTGTRMIPAQNQQPWLSSNTTEHDRSRYSYHTYVNYRNRNQVQIVRVTTKNQEVEDSASQIQEYILGDDSSSLKSQYASCSRGQVQLQEYAPVLEVAIDAKSKDLDFASVLSTVADEIDAIYGDSLIASVEHMIVVVPSGYVGLLCVASDRLLVK